MKRSLSPPIAVPDTPNIRDFWMRHADVTPGPIVGASTAVPRNLVPFLMRNKKVSSIARKYIAGDKISNFMAVLHTLVVPVVFPVWLSGVYAYENRRHVMHRLPTNTTHTVVLSALIQPDFEQKTVMYDIIKLDPLKRIVGRPLADSWEPPAADRINRETEHELKQHFVYHLSKARMLPAASEVSPSDMGTQYLKVGSDILSMELLRNCVREQLRVEFAALVDAVKDYGLKLEYTWDPPVIFARTVSPDILDELWLDAISTPGIIPAEIVTIAFNDFRNRSIIPRLRKALGQKVLICSKAELGAEPKNAGVLRVIHNNSDAFGHHILTSACSASLDGAIGSCSSAAASICTQDIQRVVYVPTAPLPEPHLKNIIIN